MIRMQTIPIELISRKGYRRLRAMTYGDGGLMQYYIDSAYSKDKTRLRYRRREVAYVLYVDGKIVGWRLLLQCRNCSICIWRNVIHIFVREKYRKLGYGKKIINTIIDLHPKLKLYCHGNIKFFKQFNIKSLT